MCISCTSQLFSHRFVDTLQFTGDGSKEDHVVYVIAIPANRYDLLCIEGFARALRIFIGLENPPVGAFISDALALYIYDDFLRTIGVSAHHAGCWTS